jgi:hypothetical protein
MTDARCFNIEDSDGRLLCPACGFAEYAAHPAYDGNGGIIRATICPCCLWEPGFDDAPGASAQAAETILGSLRAYRARWMAAPTWQGRGDRRPDDWDPDAKLVRLFDLAPHVR